MVLSEKSQSDVIIHFSKQLIITDFFTMVKIMITLKLKILNNQRCLVSSINYYSYLELDLI